VADLHPVRAFGAAGTGIGTTVGVIVASDLGEVPTSNSRHLSSEQRDE
jgi:hypothetical protein